MWGSRKICENTCFIREEWPFADKGIWINHHIYLHIKPSKDISESPGQRSPGCQPGGNPERAARELEIARMAGCDSHCGSRWVGWWAGLDSLCHCWKKRQQLDFVGTLCLTSDCWSHSCTWECSLHPLSSGIGLDAANICRKKAHVPPIVKTCKNHGLPWIFPSVNAQVNNVEHLQDSPPYSPPYIPIFHGKVLENPWFPVKIFPWKSSQDIPSIPATKPRRWMDRVPSAGIEAVAGAVAFLGSSFQKNAGSFDKHFGYFRGLVVGIFEVLCVFSFYWSDGSRCSDFVSPEGRRLCFFFRWHGGFRLSSRIWVISTYPNAICTAPPQTIELQNPTKEMLDKTHLSIFCGLLCSFRIWATRLATVSSSSSWKVRHCLGPRLGLPQRLAEKNAGAIMRFGPKAGWWGKQAKLRHCRIFRIF